LLIDDGVPGRGSRVLEFIVQGAAGGRVSLRYQSDWARLLSHELDLVAPPAP
jgi:hypothetical protein